MLTNCKSAAKPIVKVINFCGCVIFSAIQVWPLLGTGDNSSVLQGYS